MDIKLCDLGSTDYQISTGSDGNTLRFSIKMPSLSELGKLGLERHLAQKIPEVKIGKTQSAYDLTLTVPRNRLNGKNYCISCL